METPLSNNVPIESKDEDTSMRDSPAAVIIEPDPIVNADTENGCAPSSIPRPSYTLQFPSASWILDLIKNDEEPSSSNPSNKSEAVLQTEDERKDVPNGPNGSSIRDTLTMPISPTHLPLGSAANIIAANQLIGMKRKREDNEEADDFTQNTMSLPIPAPTPAVTLSVTEIPGAVRSDIEAKCSKCDESSLGSDNPFISCSSCSRLWHQGCASLLVETEDMQQASRFMCPSCLSMSDNDVANHRTGYSQQQNEIERRRAKNLAALPDDVVPPKEELVGFWAGHASDAALTEYFYGKTKTEVLNTLSFCDQLKPQLLVDIMVSVAKKHPDLPMFDSPSWNAKAMSAISARSKHSHQSSRSGTRMRHGHTVLEPRVKHKHKASKKTIKIASIPKEEESPLTDYRDSLPPMWPKAGEGLYAKLSPEDEDRAFLLDENDEEAFSHFGVDKFGKQIAIPVSA
ncbi:hypothetical protein TrVFT333_007398 [Trichoderma virens FT-333]|nr:hypothetical protein TrVFT333_007398 [Trichoderma virens FT-333]